MADLLRPRFERAVAASPACLLRRLAGDSDVEDSSVVRVSVFQSSAVLRVPSREERIWSPQLEVSFDQTILGTGCKLHGLFGPRPSVWTTFIAGYLLLLCAGFVAFIFGMSSFWLGMDARTLWLVPIACAGMAGIFIVGRLGRNRGQDQMSALLVHLMAAVNECEGQRDPETPV